jgi:hypothetical protein
VRVLPRLAEAGADVTVSAAEPWPWTDDDQHYYSPDCGPTRTWAGEPERLAEAVRGLIRTTAAAITRDRIITTLSDYGLRGRELRDAVNTATALIAGATLTIDLPEE